MHYPSAGPCKSFGDAHRECTFPRLGRLNQSGNYIWNALSLSWAVEIIWRCESGVHHTSAELFKSSVEAHGECTIHRQGNSKHSGIPIGNALSLGWPVASIRGFISGMHYPSAGPFKSIGDLHRECTIPRLGLQNHSGIHIGNALSLGWALKIIRGFT